MAPEGRRAGIDNCDTGKDFCNAGISSKVDAGVLLSYLELLDGIVVEIQPKPRLLG